MNYGYVKVRVWQEYQDQLHKPLCLCVKIIICGVALSETMTRDTGVSFIAGPKPSSLISDSLVIF